MNEIVSIVDHTMLAACSTWEDIKMICDEAAELGVASVCIPPSYVKRAAEYLDGRIPVCTVIGFPLGYQTTKIKIAEAVDAVENGAKEVDMVINLGDLKNGDYELVEKEIALIKEAIGDKILKVIIETCYLTEEEKVKMCKIVTNAGADFIKTSTGFGTAGANLKDICLFKENIGEGIKIKAAGGIRSIEDAKAFKEAGASRLGTSSICKLIKNQTVTGY